MPKGSLKLGLFDPGMTRLHRVGLAGLYMSLTTCNRNAFKGIGDWELSPKSVALHWEQTPKLLLEKIVAATFSIQDGRIDFAVHRNSGMDDISRYVLHDIILRTYLQHGRWRKLEKREQPLSLSLDDKIVTRKIKPLLSYKHQYLDKTDIFDKKTGALNKEVPIGGWLYPGGGVRHEGFKNQTTLSSDPEKFVCLLFAPIASLYFSIYHRGLDGRHDKRKGAAIVLPRINDLDHYDRCYRRYFDSPVSRLYADSLGDAGLMGLTALNLFDPSGMVKQLDVDACTVITMGKVGWASQQEIRTGMTHLENVDLDQLNHFQLAYHVLGNTTIVAEDGTFFVRTSLARGLIADNIASGRDWFRGFFKLMRTKTSARLISYERRGLNQMVEKALWSNDADKLLVEAVHKALRNRYGALAARAKQKGESAQFGREFERIRASLMRAKNAQTLRAAMADLFARGRINKALQANWRKILPLFTSPDWQRVRDLALLALVSYAGEGVEQIEEDILEAEEEI